MRGPYPLSPVHVDLSVPSKVGGVYCLGKKPREVAYVGRADSNLRDTIKSHWPEYQYFWYEPALSARECYVGHCYAFHKHTDTGFGVGDHPAAPDKVEAKCPICGK